MTSVYKIENIGIYKNRNNSFLIKSDMDDDYSLFISEFFKTINIEYNKESKSFKADKVESLKSVLNKNDNKLEYMSTVNLLHNLETMMTILRRSNLIFINLDIDDIIVIDSTKFMFINFNNIYGINEKEEIYVEKAIKPSKFTPIEMKKKEIPLKLELNAVYYNIGSLLCYSLLNTVINEETDVITQLHPIYYTKLYWFLLRCLNKEPDKRVFLFI